MQCWCRQDRDTDCHRRSSVPSLQRETGGHTKDHRQHEETENENGPDIGMSTLQALNPHTHTKIVESPCIVFIA